MMTPTPLRPDEQVAGGYLVMSLGGQSFELRVEGLDGRRFDFKVDDALNVDAISFEATDDGALAPRMNLESRWDAADMTASPHRILIVTGVSS